MCTGCDQSKTPIGNARIKWRFVELIRCQGNVRPCLISLFTSHFFFHKTPYHPVLSVHLSLATILFYIIEKKTVGDITKNATRQFFKFYFILVFNLYKAQEPLEEEVYRVDGGCFEKWKDAGIRVPYFKNNTLKGLKLYSSWYFS